MKVSGKVAVIIGGAQGIGYACAEGLLRRGAKVRFVITIIVILLCDNLGVRIRPQLLILIISFQLKK